MDLGECEWIKKKYEPIRSFEFLISFITLFELKGQDSFEFLGYFTCL